MTSKILARWNGSGLYVFVLMGGLITPSFNMDGQVVVESSSIGTRFDNMLVLGCSRLVWHNYDNYCSWPDCIAGLKQSDLAY